VEAAALVARVVTVAVVAVVVAVVAVEVIAEEVEEAEVEVVVLVAWIDIDRASAVVAVVDPLHPLLIKNASGFNKNSNHHLENRKASVLL
jgi:hypothetical protein